MWVADLFLRATREKKMRMSRLDNSNKKRNIIIIVSSMMYKNNISFSHRLFLFISEMKSKISSSSIYSLLFLSYNSFFERKGNSEVNV
jgi:hypothetical protein